MCRVVQLLFVLTVLVFGHPARAADAPPVPVKGPIEVGCYYFPGWYAAERWTPIREFGAPEPLLGYYAEGNPELADWHIRWAVEHGISFFAFDWYYDHERGRVSVHNSALDRGFLQARDRHLMKFCLLWCNESPSARRITRDQTRTMARVLRERYFGQPNYLRIDGRPVVFVSRPFAQLEALGVEGTAAAFEEMAREAGEPKGIFFVANASEKIEDLRRAGFNALSAYNYASVGVRETRGKQAPYADMVQSYEDTWKQLSSQKSLPYIPPLSPGWDSRPWYGENAFVRTGTSSELFATMCRRVQPYVDPRLKMVIVECWNEFGEGTYIEPTKRFGFSMLDAIRDAFCPQAGAHEDRTPSEAARAALVFPDVPAFVEKQVAAQGGNLVFNPGFERLWGWIYYSGEPATPVSTTPHSGRQCMAVGLDQLGVKTFYPMPVQSGRRYQVSLWIQGSAEVLCGYFDDHKHWLHRNVSLGTIKSGDAWRQFRAELVVDEAKAKYVDLQVRPIKPRGSRPPKADAATASASEDDAGQEALVDDVEVRLGR